MRLLVQQEGRVHRVRRPGLALVRDQSSTGHTEPRTPPSERRWDTARGISGAAQPGPLLEEAQSAARGRTRRAAHTRAPACRGSAIGRERGCPIDGRRRHRNDCIPSLSGRSEAPGERQSPAMSSLLSSCQIAAVRSTLCARGKHPERRGFLPASASPRRSNSCCAAGDSERPRRHMSLTLRVTRE